MRTEEQRQYDRDWYRSHIKTERSKKKSRGIARRREIKSWIDAIKTDRGCATCGYNSHAVVLQFHHRDPSTKSFNIADSYNRVARAKIVAEIDKCDVICANCHLLLTHQHR